MEQNLKTTITDEYVLVESVVLEQETNTVIGEIECQEF